MPLSAKWFSRVMIATLVLQVVLLCVAGLFLTHASYWAERSLARLEYGCNANDCLTSDWWRWWGENMAWLDDVPG